MQLFNALMARAMPWIPRALIQKISRRYIAGDNLTDTVACVRQLNRLGFAVTIDVLGESASNLQQTADTAREYMRVLMAIQDQGLNASVSVKPTALGLLLDMQDCAQHMGQILACAKRHQTSVCMDMEDVSCTQKEIELFTSLNTRYSNVSLALQAYLLRTYQDIESLVAARSSMRLCKGIYLEDRSYLVDGAWRDRSAINPHFLHHVARCFDTGSFIGIATHDSALIDQVIELVHDRRIGTDAFEFQMLLGVCEPLRDKLRGMGFRVRVYVPYGEDWYGYSIRRIKENPGIAAHIVRSLIRR
ncbi:proline dehydrogenase family protein [Undibacterium sp. TS12]|uniref:proline dehydrogenase family protein n=1 Tax=Undibacterium sp. TS12 TaxID=2908202 RepID=UPI001F4C9014|nr:proline dehydrogenase family protein [Undibacterium sp. TS12]MCH8621403.1 proline dehydrogenase family protein [Undibacterium sp. TS12]